MMRHMYSIGAVGFIKPLVLPLIHHINALRYGYMMK